MQLLLVVIVIFVPQTVTVFLTKEAVIDPESIVIEMPRSSEESLSSDTAPGAAAGTTAEQEKAAGDAEEKRIKDLFNRSK